MRRHGGALVLAIGITLVVLPGAASAATVSYSNDGVMHYAGSANSETVTITGNQSSLTISSSEPISGGTGTGGGSTCTHPSADVMTCGAVAGVELSLAEGNDTLVNGGADIAIIASGGPGNDDLTGMGGYAGLSGDDGDDQLTPGGPGSDLSGGAGTDTADYSGSVDPLNISLDDIANDGISGYQQNVHPDVENVVGGSAADVIVGDGAANRLDGGAGNDQIDGQGGADILFGGAGADTLQARDGVADSVDCGADADSATLDTIDTANGCESQNVSAELVDADGDGSPATVDCDDTNPSIHPGATDTPGNGIDEDCSGADAPAPASGSSPDGGSAPVTGSGSGSGSTADVAAVVASVVDSWITGVRTRAKQLAVKPVAAGTTIRVSCSSKKKGCPFKSKLLAPPAGAQVSLTKLFKKATLAAGAVVEIRVLRSGMVGKVFRFTMRMKKRPKRETLCLAPGATKPSACA